MNKTSHSVRRPPLAINENELGELNARVARSIQSMTPKELFKSVVAAGIYTPAGKLTKEYGGTAKRKSA
ncbi:MAG TPA: hypothetical protein VK737_12500 [Opitutales bacterium]|jgi:hypothetical protein|nr:hypothetical protein [Opitutales bacterium]